MRGIKVQVVCLSVISLSCLIFGLDIHGVRGTAGNALAAEVLKIDGLSSDPKQFRIQVDQLISKTDTLITKLRANPNHQAVILDLLQTRDDILREIPKIDSAPGDAKWTAREMMESVQSKLKLLKDQYDKASAL